MKSKTSLVQDFVQLHWNEKLNDDSLLEMCSDHVIFRTIFGSKVGSQAYQTFSKGWSSAIPDWHCRFKEIKETKRGVYAEISCQGTHLAPFTGNVFSKTSLFVALERTPPAGQKLSIQLNCLFLFEEGRIIKHIVDADEKDFETQLQLKEDASFQQSLKKRLSRPFKERPTKRELECLALAFSGFSAKHIAEVFLISYRTVETHLKNAYYKLGCNNKQQCLELMYTSHLLPLWQELCNQCLNTKLSS